MAIYQGGKKVGVVIPVVMNGEYNIEQVIEGDDCTLNITTAGIPKPDKPDQYKTVTPSTSSQVVVADPGYELASVTINPVTSDIDSNIKADNIKKDITILGVTGDYSGEENKLTQIVERTVTEITADDLVGISVIGNSAFRECDNLVSVELPESVITIDSYAFAYSDNLASVLLPNSLKHINSSAFYNDGTLTSIIIPNNVTDIGDQVFSAAGLTSITIPDNVTTLGKAVFASCSNLENVNLNNRLQELPMNIFYNCSALKSITIPDSVTSIGQQAFRGCSSLTSITIPNSVTSIGKFAFAYCSGLTSITIPNGVTSIGSYAFSNCAALTEMTILATTPPTLESKNAISTATTKIYIPKGTLSAYQSATNWSSFASKFVEMEA